MKKLLVLVVVLLLMVLMAGVAYATDGTGEGTPDFWAYITQEALVLVPVLYVIGVFIKKIPGIPDWLIPFILLGFGVVAAIAIIGFTVQGAIQGVLVTGVTVLANQLYKQGTTRL